MKLDTILMRFPGGLPKAVTLSYDDGVEEDIRLIEIMKKYGVKGTYIKSAVLSSTMGPGIKLNSLKF